MKKSLIIILALASIGFASCNGGLKQDEGGMLYQIYVDKDGPKIQTGDFISVNLIAKTDRDSVLFSTYDAGHAVQTVVPKPQFKGDIFSGLGKLAEGDSAVIKILADSMFKKGSPKPPGFKGNYLVYLVKVDKVISKGKLSDQVFQGRIADYMKSLGDVAKKQEPITMKKYAAAHKLNVQTTADGLQYVIVQQGTGPKIAVGDTAVVNYTGRLLSGKVFDTSIKDTANAAKMQVDPMRPFKPIRFPVGQRKVIPGWDEALLLLNKGSKVELIIPSSLAYGERGVSIIGPFTPIAFDMELVDIVHANPNAPKPVTMMPPPPPQAPGK